MYYYIFDIRQCKNKAHSERIKDYLAELGISGEYVFPSQVRTSKELVRDAIQRNFSTVVAIGNDALINTVASELVGAKTAFGMIPLNASTEINNLVNGSDWHSAAKNLRFRKIDEVRLGRFENGQHFLISTELKITHPVNITLEFDGFIAQARAKKLLIRNINPTAKDNRNNLLDILLISESEREARPISRLLKYLEISAQSNDVLNTSRFKAPRLRVFSHKNLNFIINKEDVATTPQLIESSPEILRLIVHRDTRFDRKS